MKIGYYPGCTLKVKAKNLEDSAVQSLKALDVELVELERWNCCGAVHNLADDDLVHFLAPVRDLMRAKEQGFETVATLCSMCYNTLARANLLMRNDEVKREALNDFMDEECNYAGEVEIVHLLTFLRDQIGWETLTKAVKNPLTDLKVAPYYGCTLTRPREVSIDNGLNPQVFEDFIQALGATVVDLSEAQTCCGSYNIVSHPEAALNTVATIVEDAGKQEADMLAMSCPLCEYNLGRRQDDALKDREGIGSVPTVYFTQLLALALGLDSDATRFDMNPEATLNFLETRKLIVTA
jgi:heterodisulfide reductase subunit B2